MSEQDEIPLDDDLRPEYDETVLRDGVRGKYYESYQEGTNVVLLEPEVARAFPDAKAVNEALRMLLSLAKTATGVAGR